MSIPSTASQLANALKRKGISNQQVLAAIAATPRHLFVDASLRDQAYCDRPLALAHGQTISQPFIVAKMTELLLAGGPLKKVLEIGTGSGYQAAVLAHLVSEIYTIERIYPLYVKACETLRRLEISNVFTQFSDGNEGWVEQAPFDGIMVTAAAESIPPSLLAQLNEGGRMIIPIGAHHQTQQLYLIARHQDDFIVEKLDMVIFVPLLQGIEQ